jgi:hypothetical protein
MAVAPLVTLTSISLSLPTPTLTEMPSPGIIVTPSATSTLTSSPVQSSTPSATIPPVFTKINLDMGPDVIYTGRNNAMKLFWGWHSSDNFQLDWGTDRNYTLGSAQVTPPNTGEDGNNATGLYSYTIEDLKPGTRYFYRLVVGQQVSVGSFVTAPEVTATQLKFVSYGDTRTHPKLHNAVAAQVVTLYENDPAYQTFNLMEGDLVQNGDAAEDWASEFFSPEFLNIRSELANLAVLPVMGNHEGSGKLFSLYFPMPFVSARYWSFDYGPAHVVMLDQYTDYEPGSAQYEWLKQDLASSKKTWKFAVLHAPGWSAGGGHENNEDVQQYLEPLFEQYSVSIVFGGHNHYYARAAVNGVQHLTIGTGGAPEYPPDPNYPNIVATYNGMGFSRFEIDGNRLSSRFIDANGKVQDEFTIQR